MVGVRSQGLCAWLFLIMLDLGSLRVGSASAESNYLVESGDTLNIIVYRLGDLSRRTIVDADGNLSFPPFGQIKVAGLSLQEI